MALQDPSWLFEGAGLHQDQVTLSSEKPSERLEIAPSVMGTPKVPVSEGAFRVSGPEHDPVPALLIANANVKG